MEVPDVAKRPEISADEITGRQIGGRRDREKKKIWVMTTASRHGPPKIPSSVRPCTDTSANKALGSLVVGHFQRVKKPDMFVSILASEAANLALKILATGGVYLAVDIPMRILKVLLTPRFMESFKRKGRLSELMERIPIHVVIARVALIGAAARGLEKFKEETP
jgi:hypothetical protein